MEEYINLGCGNRFLNDWTNVDFISSNAYVLSHNLLKPIPFEENSFDVVYHSHVLEHFTKSDAERFINECYRILKPGGVMRIAVPDLEPIAKNYVNALDKVSKHPEPFNVADYEWSMLELYDQVVRTRSGGEMGKFWTQDSIINQKTLTNRVGDEFVQFRNAFELNQSAIDFDGTEFKKTFIDRIKHRLLVWLLRDSEYEEHLKLANFRLGGEIHQWMYDSFSLGQLLMKCGFYNIVKRDAFTSSIADWEKQCWLDVEDGKVRKPDSLFMEAIK